MNILERTARSMELLAMDKSVLKDIIIKYGILADAYAGSSDDSLIKSNKETYEILLSNTVIDLMSYLNVLGELTPYMGSNLNLSKIFNQANKGIYITDIARDLISKGFAIKNDVTLDDITHSLVIWGVSSVDSDEDISENIEEIEQETIPENINSKLFDDDSFSNIENIEDLEDLEAEIEQELMEDEGVQEVYEDATGEPEQPIQPEQPSESEQPAQPEQAEEKPVEQRELTEEEKEAAELHRLYTKLLYEDDNSPYKKRMDELIAEIQNNASTDGEDKSEELNAKISELEEEAFDAATTAINKKRSDAEEREIKKEIKDNSGEIDETIVKKILNNILNVYDVMYKPLFETTPMGVLTTFGILSEKIDNSTYIVGNGKMYALELNRGLQENYPGAIKELDYHEEISLNCFNEDGSLRYNYAPLLQVRNIFGIYRGPDGVLHREKNWSKFRVILSKSIISNIKTIMKGFPADKILKLGSSITELYTTAFIISEFDIEKSLRMSLKSMTVGRTNAGSIAGFQKFGNWIRSGIESVDPSTVSIIDNSEMEQGVHNLLAVFDDKTYNGEILFAYKPLKNILGSGGQVGIKKLLIGRDIKGNNVTLNFESPQLVDTLVIAGSGSGKGVVTLNMLATFIAEGCPTVYMDWKPDMAAMLWNVERQTGAKILAIDGLSGKSSDGIVPVRDYKIGTNDPDLGIGNLNVLAYLKLFQLMILTAQARNIGYQKLNTNKKMFFILDEAQAMAEVFDSVMSDMSSILEDKENKPSKNKPATPKYLYAKRLLAFCKELFSGAVTFRNTTGRTGNVGMVMLGQQADCSAWSKGALKRSTFGFLVGNCSMKLLGKDATDNTKYSLNGATPAGSKYLGQMGYFAVVPKAVADKTPGQVKVIKTYLALNENDYDPSTGVAGRCTGGMLKNVTDEILKNKLIHEDFCYTDDNGNELRNEAVGFLGLVELMGSTKPDFDIVKNLQGGYDVIDAVCRGFGITGENGRYSCIEEYLFDRSLGSIFKTSELQKLFQTGETIASIQIEELGEGGPEQNSDGQQTLGDVRGNTPLDIVVEDEEEIPIELAPNPKKLPNNTPKPQQTQGLSVEDKKRLIEEQRKKQLTSNMRNQTQELLHRAGSDRGIVTGPFVGREDSKAAEESIREVVNNRRAEDKKVNTTANQDIENLNSQEQQQQDQSQPQQSEPSRPQTSPEFMDINVLPNQTQSQMDEEVQNLNRQTQQSQPQPQPQQQQAQPVQPTQEELATRLEELLNMMNSGGNTDPQLAQNIQQIRESIINNMTPENLNNNYNYPPGSTQPEELSPNSSTLFNSGGRTGRVQWVTPESTTTALALTTDNSYVVEMPEYETAENFSKRFFKTLWGTQYEFKNRWKKILNTVSQSSNALMITRLSIMSDIIAFNKRIVSTINLFGGEEDIRISDIVQFKMTAKKFPNIKELSLDPEIYEVATIELGSAENLFGIFPKLQVLKVYNDSRKENTAFTRNEVLQNMLNEEARRLQEQAEFRSQLDIVMSAKNPKFASKSPGFKNKIIRSSNKYNGGGWGEARNSLVRKDRGWATKTKAGLGMVATLGIGFVAASAGMVGRIFRRK